MKKKPAKGKSKRPTFMMRKKPNGVGRPSPDFNKNVLARIEEMASNGMHEYQIASALGIHRDTFIDHKKINSDITDALERGLAKGIDAITRGLKVNATADLSAFGQPGGHVGAQKFYLERKGGWKAESEIKVSGEVKTVIKVEIPAIERRHTIDV